MMTLVAHNQLDKTHEKRQRASFSLCLRGWDLFRPPSRDFCGLDTVGEA